MEEAGLIIIFMLIIAGINVYVFYSRHRRKQALLAQKQAIEHQKKRQRESQEYARQKAKREREEKIVKFHKNVFPVYSDNQAIEEKWNFWNHDLHNADMQLVRQERALYKTVPISIDTKELNAIFMSYDCHQLYYTDLRECTCPDFEENQVPCKHMYRLFYDLHHPKQSAGITDVSDDIMSAFYKLSNTGKLHFLRSAIHLPQNGQLIDLDKNLDWHLVIKAGLVEKRPVPMSEYTALLNGRTKTQIIEALGVHGVTDCRPSWTKEKIVTWVEKEHPEFMQRYFIGYSTLVLPENVAMWADGIINSIKGYSVSTPMDAYWIK